MTSNKARIVLTEAQPVNVPDTLVDRETAPVQISPAVGDPLLDKQIEETTAYIRELFSQQRAK